MAVDLENIKQDYLGQQGMYNLGAFNINDLPADQKQSTIEAFNNSDRHQILDDGSVAFVDKDGSTQLIPASASEKNIDVSGLDANAVKELADLKYLAQNTGVNTKDLNAVYDKLGISGSTYTGSDVSNASLVADDILKAYGYKPGEQKNFYGNNQANDVGAQILYERWQESPTDEELEAAGIDPTSVTIINSNTANAAYLAEKLAERGVSSSSTAARVSGANRLSVQEAEAQTEQAVKGNEYWKDKVAKAGSYGDATLNMLEWDLIKKEGTGVDTTGYSVDRPSATITGGTTNIPGGGQVTGGATGTYGGPTFVSTPNIGAVTDVYGSGQTGLTETTIPTYEDGLKKQATQFADRATCQATFYKPQTQAEKEAAGNAPSFENRMYRNRFGMTQYIQFIKGPDGVMRPTTPIPQGYYEVQGFGAQQQATGAAQGGMIQGYNEAGLVNPAMNFQPGGIVVQASDGTYKIKYPDGTYSQSYDTAMNAKAALDMGTSNLGLPDYGTYLQQQGYDMNLPGYNQDQMYSAYQSYLQDPATLEKIKADQAAAEAASQQQTQQPIEATVGSDMPMGETQVTPEDLAQYQANLNAQAFAAPGGAVAASPVSYLDPNAYGTVMESTAGQAQATAPMVQEDQVAQISSATTADVPVGQGAATYTANQGYTDVQQATEGMTAATITAPTKEIEAAQQTGTSLSGLTSATGDSINVSGAPTRELETMGGQSELITGTGVDQSKVLAAFGEGEIKAASVQDELTGLMKQFEGGDTPAWAAGSMRSAMATLAARGLGASSMAGQAVIQAAMEAALPIAQIDAGNKQQMALFKGEQRAKFLQIEFDQAFQAKVMNAAKVSEIANMNFTAQQQIALENSRAANTMNLQNLSNKQALVLAEASALSGMDMTNLNNRQQAAVQNAQNFLQVDMANLSNSQQTALFKQQSLINSILSDQAAANAAAQFNSTSENQTNQFFSNLASSVNQFNAAQMNAMKQFNADEVNGLLEFNAALQNQREMFNAQNYLVVAQANAQWRQNTNTLNTAAANQSNMEYAKNVNNLTQAALDEIWMRERDLLSMAFQSSENTLARNNAIVLQKLAANASTEAAQLQADIEAESGASNLLASVFMKAVGLI